MPDSNDVYKGLTENHLVLTDEESRVLAATIVGIQFADIVKGLFKATRTVRTVLQRVEDLVCIPAGMEKRQPAPLGLWFEVHRDCEKKCAAVALGYILSNSILPPNPPPDRRPERRPARPVRGPDNGEGSERRNNRFAAFGGLRGHWPSRSSSGNNWRRRRERQTCPWNSCD